jgi:hypothetical protein
MDPEVKRGQNEEDFSLLAAAYERAAEELDEYARSVFDDVKLLAVVGSMVAWGPVEGVLFGDKEHGVKAAISGADAGVAFFGEPLVLLLGFLVILTVLAVIALRDIVKSSFILYYVDYLIELEERLAAFRGVKAPHGMRKWKRWHKAVHGPQQRIFRGFICGVVFVLPSALLAARACFWSLGIYAVAFAGVIATMRVAQSKMRRSREGRWAEPGPT